MYELHSKKLYNYQTTFYRCYARKSKINEQPNTFCNVSNLLVNVIFVFFFFRS